MPVQTIDLSAPVQVQREKCADDACSQFNECLAWLAGPAQSLPIHEVEREVLGRIMALGCALMALWLALRVPSSVSLVRTHGRASYRFGRLAEEVVRTRFGEVFWARPVYERVHGRGPATIAPEDRAVGLASGRMSLGVHLLAGWLAARLVFDDVVEVLGQFGGYVPSKRAILGIVDQLGPHAAAVLADMPAPEGDGEILVIQCDDKGAPMIGSREHARRCRPHVKRPRGESNRSARRSRRRERPRVRRSKGKKSKNARMGKTFVIYTLRRCRDGSLEGPLNKRVIATFKSRRHGFEMALREATKRGYGSKPTYFLADGSDAIWRMQREFFPQATTCIDWYHVCEYLWAAGGTVLREGSPELAEWVHARKRQLLTGRVEAMLHDMRALSAHIGRSGPGTKGRRERLQRAIGYIERHRARLRYRELARMDMDIATGAVEGAVNHVIGRRLDGSMMRWSPARAGHIVALRCIALNGLWDHLSKTVSDAHLRCRDPIIPRITPPRPQEPYDAVRKAA